MLPPYRPPACAAGNVMVTRVNLPGAVATPTRPPIWRMWSAMRFIPTPRPASLVALSSVENPGWNSNASICLASSVSHLIGRDEPLLYRRLLDALGGEPAAVVLDAHLVSALGDLLEIHAHDPLRGLARGVRSAGRSMPCTMALRIAWMAMSLTMRR